MVNSILDYYEKHKGSVDKLEYVRLSRMIDARMAKVAMVAEDHGRAVLQGVSTREMSKGQEPGYTPNGPGFHDVDVVMHNIHRDVGDFLENVQADRLMGASEVERLRMEVTVLQERLRERDPSSELASIQPKRRSQLIGARRSGSIPSSESSGRRLGRSVSFSGKTE